MSRLPTLSLALLGAAITVSAVPSRARAQGTASASLSVAAQVIVPISLTTTAPLDFGRVFAGGSKLVSPDGPMSGRFNVAGQPGSAVTVTLTMPSAVTAAGGGSIPLSAWTYVSSTSATLNASTPVNFNGGTATPVAIVLSGGSGTSTLYFGIGATAAIPANASAAVYSATGQITAAYTDL